jgi:hypothetical protein
VITETVRGAANMTISILSATSLQKVLLSGRTKPCIFFCEDESGEKSGEYVVKLKVGVETGGNVNEQ